MFFAMKLSPKVFNTFRRFQPFSPIFHVHRCLKKISMFDALFTLKSPVIVGMSWPGRKTLLGKGGNMSVHQGAGLPSSKLLGAEFQLQRILAQNAVPWI